MSVFLFLNELSYAEAVPVDQFTRVMTSLVAVLRDVRERRRDIVLFTMSPLKKIELAPGYSIARWADDGRNKDTLRFLRMLENRAPFRSAGLLEGDGTSAVDYLYGDYPARGLGYAHALDGLAVSMSTSRDWDTAVVVLVRQILIDDPDIDLTESRVSVRHAAAGGHVEKHATWLGSTDLAGVVSGRELWERRQAVFPHLDFLPRVEQDLAALPLDWLRPVRDRLVELEQATAEWTSGAPMPQWYSRVTPEAENRKRLCKFVDLDGEERVFDLHARFTPHHGRIHFGINYSRRSLTIAYVGRKRGT